MGRHSCFAGHGLVRFATARTDLDEVVWIGHQVSLSQIYMCVYVCVWSRLDGKLLQNGSFYK